jgi:hypothetical protein
VGVEFETSEGRLAGEASRATSVTAPLVRATTFVRLNGTGDLDGLRAGLTRAK